jgi:AhpD family alkylhydroperoxidase
MDKKTQELIAIGAAVTANCVPCFKFHFAKAREELASDDEVREAVRVGRTVRRGLLKPGMTISLKYLPDLVFALSLSRR